MSDPIRFVGVVGGRIGGDPFNRRTFSGSSYSLFTTMKKAGVLERAFGAELSPGMRAFVIAQTFNPNRDVWSRKFNLDNGYRNYLTKQLAQEIRSTDLKCSFLQIGAMFDMPSIVGGKAPCLAYHDGNLPEAMRGGQMDGVPTKTLAAALKYERELALRCDLIFTIGDFLKRSFIEDYGIRPEKIVTVGGGPNFDEVPEFNEAKRYDTQELLYVGIDYQRKGLWNLLNAFSNLRDRFPKSRLHIIGPKKLHIPAGLSSGVIFHGYVSRQNAEGAELFRQLYESCSAFVLPSLYEPFGMSSLEAMLHQVPVVVTRGWGWLDTVRDGFNGYHVERGSVDHLTEVLARCFSDSEKLKTMGTNGRNFILDRFNWDAVVERMCFAASNYGESRRNAQAMAGAR